MNSSGTDVRWGGVAVKEVSAIGDKFQRHVELAIESIPRPILDGLERASWQLMTAEFVVDAAAELHGIQPRGWPRGMGWENTDAVHLPKKRVLVIAEKLRNQNGKIFFSPRVEGVTRHEVGHAFDMLSARTGRYRSSEPEFVAAYTHDSRQMTADNQTVLAYYVQAGTAGRQETFAEAFGISLGGGSATRLEEMFVAAFPSVMKLVREDIGDYQPNTQTGPARKRRIRRRR